MSGKVRAKQQKKVNKHKQTSISPKEKEAADQLKQAQKATTENQGAEPIKENKNSAIMNFDDLNNKRKAKIEQLNEQINKLKTLLNENKSIQFYKQKAKQLGSIWNSILVTTDDIRGSLPGG